MNLIVIHLKLGVFWILWTWWRDTWSSARARLPIRVCIIFSRLHNFFCPSIFPLLLALVIRFNSKSFYVLFVKKVIDILTVFSSLGCFIFSNIWISFLWWACFIQIQIFFWLCLLLIIFICTWWTYFVSKGANWSLIKWHAIFEVITSLNIPLLFNSCHFSVFLNNM